MTREATLALDPAPLRAGGARHVRGVVPGVAPQPDEALPAPRPEPAFAGKTLRRQNLSPVFAGSRRPLPDPPEWMVPMDPSDVPLRNSNGNSTETKRSARFMPGGR